MIAITGISLRNTLSCSLVSSLFLTTISSAQTLSLADYIALQPGNWNYTSSGFATPVTTSTRTDYTRRTNITGGSHFTTSLRFTNDGLILLGEVSTIPGNDYNETETPVTIMIPPNPVVNGTATTDFGSYSGTSSEGPYSGTRTVTTEVKDFETVTVPAGSYSALKIIITSDWDEGAETGTITNTLWLAKGTGVVRFRYQSDGFDGTFNLTSSPPRPAAPTGGPATSATKSVQLFWPVVPGVDAYRISRGATTDPAAATLLGTAPQPGSGSTVTFTDSTTAGTTPYFYFLESSIGTAVSEFSAPIAGSAQSDFSTSTTDRGLTGNDALPDSDPNHDGIDNAIAYALGIPLVGSVSTEEFARLPQSSGATENNLPLFKFTLPDDVPDDVIYVIESTTNISTPSWDEIARKTGDAAWSGEASVAVGVPSDGFVSVEVEGTQTMAAAPLGFMRLRVLFVEQ